MGRTKKRIIIELYRQTVGYKRLAKILDVGLDTVRSHLKRGRISCSLEEQGIVEQIKGGWTLTAKGRKIAEELKDDPQLKGFFY